MICLKLPQYHFEKNFFESNLNFKGFHEVSRITARVGTVRGTSGIITFGENDPEPTSGIGITLFIGTWKNADEMFW